jgi:hypothetical protein
MAYYRLYYLEDGHIRRVLEIDCEDDASAMKIAEQRADGRAMELWELSRIVARWDATQVVHTGTEAPEGA